MFKRIGLALALLLGALDSASAQNTQCANRPNGDSTNACANTRFVQTAVPLLAITGLTGDGTATGPGNVALTLATVNGNVGSWGSATQCPSFTVNAKGLITAASQVACTPSLTVGTTAITSGVDRGELYNNAGVLGNLASLAYDVRKYAVAPKTASTVCNGSGDDTASIQAAVDAANTNVGGTVVFPAGACIIASTLSFNDKRNMVLQGQGGGRNLSSAVTSVTYSAATGNAATFDGAIGIVSRGINWLYSHATYNGDLFDLRQESGAANTNLITFEDCFIWGNSGTAASFFRLGAGVSGGSRATLSFRLQRCLLQGAVQAINGGTNSNNVYIANNFFNTNTGTTSHIGVRGEGWTLLNNTFEPTATTVANNVIANGATNGLAIIGNTFNDSVTGTLITLTGGVVTGLHVAGNILQGGDYSINVGSAVGVNVNGNYLNSNSVNNLIVPSATAVMAQGNWGPGTLVSPLPASGTYFIDRNSGSNLLASVGFSLGIAGSRVGSIEFNNATSGTITLQPTTGALGTSTLTLPALSKTVTVTIASGAKALATGAISSATCTSAQTDTATGTLTTDTITATFNGDPTAVTGYVPLTTGMLTIIPYPTTDTVNFKVCNNTASSITPGAITINWRVMR